MALVAAGRLPKARSGHGRWKPAHEGGLDVPRAATLRAGRNSEREDHQSELKPRLKPVHVPPRQRNAPVHLSGRSPRIQPSEEPVIEHAITLIRGKWKIAILCQLQDGPLRVGELKRRMTPISKKVLNQHLRRMENEGLLVRTEVTGRIPHVEYALTNSLGSSVLRLLQAIALWGGTGP